MKRNSLWALALAAVWIAAAAVGCLVPASSASAATVASGSCGASGFSLTWTLDDQGTLTISGQGTMRDYGYGEAPEAWKNAKKLIVTEGVESIGDSAFDGLWSLTQVSLPASLAQMDHYMFSTCYNLTRIDVAAGNTEYSSIDGVLFNGEATALYLYPCGRKGPYSVPVGVELIAPDAFYICGSLTVTLPESVEVLDGSAFEGCSNLTVFLPRSLIYIDDNAFVMCEGITLFGYQDSYAALWAEDTGYSMILLDGTKLLRLPAGLKSIEDKAFMGLPVKEVLIPAGCTSIGSQSFADCSSLYQVYMPDSVTSIASDAFSGTMAVFVCASDNYAAQYARTHGFKYRYQ